MDTMEAHIKVSTVESKAFAAEICMRAEDYLIQQKFEERINRIDEMLAGHNFYVQNFYQIKPGKLTPSRRAFRRLPSG